jgi:hypothetical protein
MMDGLDSKDFDSLRWEEEAPRSGLVSQPSHGQRVGRA